MKNYDDLKNILEEIIRILKGAGEKDYVEIFSSDISRVKYLEENPKDQETIDGLKSIKTMYGGMGTFQDLVLGGTSGRCTPEEIALNKRLSELRHQLYKLVDEL